MWNTAPTPSLLAQAALAASQIKHATNRPAELEKNRYEPGQMVEAQVVDTGEWKAAVVRSCNEQGLYTIQHHPVESNRQKKVWNRVSHITCDIPSRCL